MAKKDAVENLGPFGTLESVLTEKCRIMSTACNRERLLLGCMSLLRLLLFIDEPYDYRRSIAKGQRFNIDMVVL